MLRKLTKHSDWKLRDLIWQTSLCPSTRGTAAFGNNIQQPHAKITQRCGTCISESMNASFTTTEPSDLPTSPTHIATTLQNRISRTNYSPRKRDHSLPTLLAPQPQHQTPVTRACRNGPKDPPERLRDYWTYSGWGRVFLYPSIVLAQGHTENSITSHEGRTLTLSG